MIFVKELKNKNFAKAHSEYPMCLPFMSQFSSMKFTHDITILTGDNGSGKTTLLEIIACLLGANRVSYNLLESDKQKQVASSAKHFTIASNGRAKSNFYFSGEEFIQYIDWVEREKQEARKALIEIEEEYGDNTYAKTLARTPHLRTLGELDYLHASNLAKQSHGQGYLDFFSNRLQGHGLYLLDEPESALTYENQYVLSLEIREALKMGCQFIIATHSPIITAIPEAQILEISDQGIAESSYDQLDNIRFLKMFLSSPERMFREI